MVNLGQLIEKSLDEEGAPTYDHIVIECTGASYGSCHCSPPCQISVNTVLRCGGTEANTRQVPRSSP
eukprot:SAG31_NODE_1547_length_7925_cov_3.563251_4_plen_67_part_00